MEWFYDNCNWRCGRARGTFAVTSTMHGAPIGTASNPCETLYKVLLEVRKRARAKKEGNWVEEVYVKIVKTAKTVRDIVRVIPRFLQGFQFRSGSKFAE